MAKVGRMSEEFREFLKQEIIPLIQNYTPKNNQEEWYCKWKLIPAQQTYPDTYIKMLLKLREDSKVTFQFKVFMLQLASIINNKFLKSKETKLS